jgi:cell division protein FtsW (lipid II flippase)
LFEALFTLAAIAALLPLFGIVATEDTGRGGRFADDPAALPGLPPAVLPGACRSVGPLADAPIRDRLCPGPGTRSSGVPLEQSAATLIDATARATAAFTGSLRQDQARLAELRSQQRESAADSRALREAIAASDERVRIFAQRYAIDQAGGAPAPLRCASASIAATFRPTPPDRSTDAPRAANALLLLGAALDGHPAAGVLARQAALPAANRLAPRTCGALGLPDALARTSLLMADARQATTSGAKNEAMRELLRTAGWQWAGAMLLGFAFLTLSRRSRSATPGVALALAVWAVAAWVGRVPWPHAAERAFVPGRESVSWLTSPAAFVVWLLAAAVLLLVAAPALRKSLRCTPQAPSSRVGYAGFVALTGVGWLVLLDLSANASYANRYLALYHHGHLWLAMLLLSALLFLRQPLGRFLAWALSVIDGVANRVGRRTGTLGAAALAIVATAALVTAFAVLLANLPQVTSEIGRLWLMLGAAWFFFLRGTPLAERLARSGGSFASLVRYVLPLAFVVLVLIGAMLMTHDMGPLLIAGYGAGAFLAASVAMWMHQRYGTSYTAHAVAMAVFVGWIVLVTFALFETGSIDNTTAGRLENLAAPLASANDQLAIVSWFQHAAPPAGFGLGHVPWCGYGGAVGCAGVPAQVHSDYTFTALVGAFGWTAAWTVTLGCAIWLHRLIRQHGRITPGEPRLVAESARLVNDEQGFLSWLAVTWVVLALCQLAVTVSGNLAVIPLTGVTFPFVSFGMTSLLVNVALLALCLNVNVPGRGHR